ncbi:MAG: hypothetical protein ACOWWM_17740 [Desulfobacterales bacterium]
MIKILMNRDDALLLHDALLVVDGPTLRPEWTHSKQAGLTAALDKLRLSIALETESTSHTKEDAA